MAFNSIGQYSANHKVWDHVGNILPNIEFSEGERPAIEWKVAEWLPVQFFDKHYENWFVIMPGKVVATDNDGRLVPAGLKIAVELAGSGAVVTYTTNDVAAGVINVTTGSPVKTSELSSGTVSYTAAQINAAGFMGRSGVSIRIGNPVGVAPYAYLQWAGGDGFNPTNYRKHNYNMQHQVSVLCDYVLEMPLVPTSASNESINFSPSASLTDSASIWTSSGLSNLPAATNTVRTPVTFAGTNASTLFVNQVTDVSKLLGAGDWFMDTSTGNISVFAASQPTGITVSYFHYAASPASVSKFACAVGDLKGGDLVTFNADSNFCPVTRSTVFLSVSPTGDEVARSLGLVVGQILDRDSSLPRDFLDRVKTSYAPAIGTDPSGAVPGYLGQLDQMPGTADGGMPSNVHYSGAADTVVRINLTRF